MKPSDSWRTREEQDELIDAFQEGDLSLKEFATLKGVRPNYISHLCFKRRQREKIAHERIDKQETNLTPLPILRPTRIIK